MRVLGRLVRSVVYTTDIAIIRNCDADAVWAVYPFTSQQVISDMLVKASSIPVFVGVGGGRRTAEFVVVLRAEFPDLPILATGGSTEESVAETAAAGANAIICSPPTNRELFSPMMDRYREEAGPRANMGEMRRPSKAALEEMRGRLQGLRDNGLVPPEVERME